MLPFLKNRSDSGSSQVIEKDRAPDSEQSALSDIEACVSDFMAAAQKNDIKKMAEIVKIAHDLLHEHMDSESQGED